MISRIFVVYDSKAEAYLQPHFAPTVGLAMRSWEVAVNSSDTQFGKFPADFTLFEIGTYDDLTGTLVMHQSKVNLGLALDVLKKPSSQLPLLDNVSLLKK